MKKIVVIFYIILNCIIFSDNSLKLVKKYYHNNNYFTQGFYYEDGIIYEGTGLRKKSKLLKYKLGEKKTINEKNLFKTNFGEGISVLNNKIYQVIWLLGTCYVYNKENFEMEDFFYYKGEGWGLTNNGEDLIMSNGSEYLFFRDAKTFKIKTKLEIKENNLKVKLINELEYINGFVYANIWKEDYIIIIDIKTGKVIKRIYFTEIVKQEKKDKNVNVLNGIAYNDKKHTILITGKLWNNIYEFELE